MCKKNENSRGRPFVMVLLSVVLAFLLCACSSTPKANEPDRSGLRLKKRICITRFEDKKRFDDSYLNRSFQDLLQDKLDYRCKKPIFITPAHKEYPEEFDQLPVLKSGIVDTMVLMDVGRRNGFNAVVTGSVSDIRQKDEKGWLQGEQSYMQVAITAEVYDTQTGAKLLSRNFLQEIEVDLAEASEIEEQDAYFDLIAIEKAFAEIVDEMQPDICETISDMPWKGFITDESGDRVVISAGKNVGLKKGNRLNVYRNDQIMAGAFGSRFRIPGPKIGLIKLVSVSDHQSEAILIDGTGATVGNSVGLK